MSALSISLLNKRGMKSLREIAKETNISPSTLSRIENGGMPDIETYIAICDWMRVPIDAFIDINSPANQGLPEIDNDNRLLSKVTIKEFKTIVDNSLDKLLKTKQ